MNTYKGEPTALAPTANAVPFRILIVEDDISLKEVILRSLKKVAQNIEVKWVTSADHFFLDQSGNLMKGKKSFDLVLTDINMPGACSGLEVWTHFAASDPDVPVVVMSGLTQSEFCSRLGVDEVVPDYVQKPLSPQKCAAVLDRHLRR